MSKQGASHLDAGSLQSVGEKIAVPGYNRNVLHPAILHIGVGGFHRAHMAVYTDDLLNAGRTDWSINGVGLRRGDSTMARVLHDQDGLYTLIVRGRNTEDARVVGSITDYFHAPDGSAGLCLHVAAADYRIISLTVTEDGYHYAGEDRHLDTDHPEVAHDLTAHQDPKTAVGFIFRVAQLRIESKQALPTFLSCDNIPHNGNTLRALVLQYAHHVDPEVDAALTEEGRFPNCMVDRITPATTDTDRAYVHNQLGIDDGWPVVCEDFRQWYVEDEFSNGRPEWEAVGAEFVSDVQPYERMKIRLLNGAHSALAYISHLLGYRRVDHAMADSGIGEFVRRYMAEIEPTVGSVPGIDLHQYQVTLLERFSNPAVADQVLRLCEDGSRKIPNMMLEPLSELERSGISAKHGAFAIAAWIRFLRGRDEEGKSIDIKDPNAYMLTKTANLCEDDVAPFLEMTGVFPVQLSQNRAFSREVHRRYLQIRKDGIRTALQSLLEIG